MALFLYDFGTFQQLERIFLMHKGEIKRDIIDERLNSENMGSSEANELDDMFPTAATPISLTKKSSNRRMSVPPLSRNRSLVKSREQRTTSVVGIPHRHHITIAVNDEPVDIIKTTCTGPCLQTCCNNSEIKKHSNVSSTNNNNNNSKLPNDVDENGFNFKNQTKQGLMLTLIYIISSVSIRSNISIDTTINNKNTIQKKVCLFIFYLLCATLTCLLSLRTDENDTQILTLKYRLKLIIAIFIIILWSGLNILVFLPFPWIIPILAAILLSIGVSFIWDCYFQFVSNWNLEIINKGYCNKLTEIRSKKSSIYSILAVSSHSLHLWSSLLIFILLESLDLKRFQMNINLKGSENKLNSNNDSNENGLSNNSYRCGLRFNELSSVKLTSVPQPFTPVLFYISIGLSFVSLIVAILLVSTATNKKTSHQTAAVQNEQLPQRDSSHNSSSQPLNITAAANQIGDTHQSISPINSEAPTGSVAANGESPYFVNSSDSSDNVQRRLTNGRLTNSVILKLLSTKNVLFKVISPKIIQISLPMFFSMGLLEGFIISDYNEKFVGCYQSASFIGLFMLMLALAPLLQVNFVASVLLPLRFTSVRHRHHHHHQIPAPPPPAEAEQQQQQQQQHQQKQHQPKISSRLFIVLLLSIAGVIRSILLPISAVLLSVGGDAVAGHWLLLLVVFPILVAGDMVLGLVILYFTALHLSRNYRNDAIVLMRMVRLAGISCYLILSCTFGITVSMATTMLLHCAICPLMFILCSCFMNVPLGTM